MKYLSFLLLFFCFLLISCSTHRNVLKKDILIDAELQQIIKEPRYGVQILYTHVDLKDTSFTSYRFNVDDNEYFYPASTVKMPVAILALQKKNEINRLENQLTISDIMLTNANRPLQTPAFIDTTTESGKPTMERYIEKIFAVSDNDAFNRLYEFLGQDYINQSLRDKKVFKKSVINHRLSIAGLNPDENKHTNAVRFFRDMKIVYDKPDEYAKGNWFHKAKNAKKGIGYTDDNDKLVSTPFDFSKKNFYAIEEMEATIKRIIFPLKFSKDQQFDLISEDYVFLKKAMSSLPKDYSFYRNDPEYYDSYVKFFMYGDSKDAISSKIKIYNKVGNAYGYMIDCAYIEDKENQIGFFLTAVIHTNKNEIYNDGIYEYDEVALPFLSRLGKQIYNFELKTKN